ncbi:MAG TPA: 2-phospho-L-lactate transferase [Candidatus Dormibacteraeota bacterium]|jgi:LPPG:FO 2-phospho-L-lactate transferase|nr:2-phospho-L-lactate transferase [Candidatus Dormibacteraeota bacterium]
MTGAGHPASRPHAAVDAAEGTRIVALAGGVGAARFLRGLVRVIDPSSLTVVVNTADDVERHGLWISPDIDSVLYTLSGLHDEERGWGLRDETWTTLSALSALGEDTWFQLGDRDLATHIWRTSRRRAGVPLSALTAELARRLGVAVRVLPMSDDVVTTRIASPGLGDLHFQEYFVREQCRPPISSIRFEGIAASRPAPGVVEALSSCDAVIVCPSNPVISIGPILAVPGVRAALQAVPRCVAVTPIVAGEALKGPAAAMLRQQGVAVSAAGVAGLYADFCSAMVVDRRDAPVAREVEALGLRAVVTETVMASLADAVSLAGVVMQTVRDDSGPAVAA